MAVGDGCRKFRFVACRHKQVSMFVFFPPSIHISTDGEYV